MSKILVFDDDGANGALVDMKTALESYLCVEQVETDPANPANPVFRDEFRSLSIQDGQLPATGALYDDSFAGWKIRNLHTPPNLDIGIKQYKQGKTHLLQDGGTLLLRGIEDPQSPTGYTAGMISTERSNTFLYGRFKLSVKANNLAPGCHFSWWMKPADLDGEYSHVEYGMLELIGSNKWRPEGPIDTVFVSAKDKSESYFHAHGVASGFMDHWHDYEMIWTKDGIEWRVDGDKIHEAPNLINEPMFMMATIEMGASSNGDFPGPIKKTNAWPMEIALRNLEVWEK